ncbi:rhamnogalacturonan acetylesterase [Actinomadura sp. ATCC 31491]|uniref:Rhamnogalacturonan acetylesterase n=1 Tax=Actinomadura luzonensis TaxID=2805427 RepID=A0ABT0FW33_9ACTN|nr:rhamnogalacturonan acetylesterase [Actinomadura luzonensis]MCK2216545.1 rhamnogalacturonan acetylesterase [Actinomadura luzonensis]
MTRTVLLAGDSTVASCPASEAPMSGWGAQLGAYAGGPVRNFAKGGATTASHRAEGLWAALLREAVPGDLVVLQFGHNDQKEPELPYQENLRAFLGEARAAGARPVLCTPVQRRRWAGGRLVPTHGRYPGLVRDLAAAEDVPLVDLTAATTALYERLGPEGSKALFTHFPPGAHPLHPGGVADDTHFCFRGADEVAAIVAARLKEIA